MKEKIKNEILLLFNDYCESEDLKTVDRKLDLIFSNYEVSMNENDEIKREYSVPETIQSYLITKKIAGLSEKTLYLYNIVLNDFFAKVRKINEDVTSNDIKVYLYKYQENTNISNRTLDTRRTILSSYFGWLAAEEYISKNPSINIAPIKYERIHKKPMTQMDLEKIRNACETSRERAIVELLYSTGARVSELEHLNISDVDFENKEVVLFGKGSKHRVSYLNAKAEVALKKYLEEREDENEALFVYSKKPYDRLQKSGIELIIKNIESRTDGINIHVTPHIFRHTTATEALDRGMSVVEVSKLLGHARLETTMEYINTNSNSIKNSYQKSIV